MASPLRGVRVIVAGAGLAGLTAAHTLAERGASVQLFEARDRTGGRVWTWRGTAPFHVELGGEFIESDHTAIKRLCREFRLPLVRVLGGGFGLALQQGRGVRVSARLGPAWTAFARTLTPYTRAFESAGREWSSTAAAAIASRSLADVLARARAPAAVRGLALSMRNLYLAGPEQLSALVAAEEVMQGGDPGDARFFRIRGGNDRLVEALSARLGDRVRTGHAVRAIAEDGRGVRATVDAPSGRRMDARADFVVLALPLPLLRALTIAPPLPAALRLAIDSLSMGNATKVVLGYSRPWWRRSRRPRAFATDLPIGAVWEAAEEQRGAALLTLLGGGDASASLRRLARTEGAAGLTARLGWLGRPPDGAALVKSVSWERDPWAGGGYAYFGPRFDPALQPLLARSAGRIVFAGSHTSQQFVGYMNGAVESGVRAANEVESLMRLP